MEISFFFFQINTPHFIARTLSVTYRRGDALRVIALGKMARMFLLAVIHGRCEIAGVVALQISYGRLSTRHKTRICIIAFQRTLLHFHDQLRNLWQFGAIFMHTIIIDIVQQYERIQLIVHLLQFGFQQFYIVADNVESCVIFGPEVNQALLEFLHIDGELTLVVQVKEIGTWRRRYVVVEYIRKYCDFALEKFS